MDANSNFYLKYAKHWMYETQMLENVMASMLNVLQRHFALASMFSAFIGLDAIFEHFSLYMSNNKLYIVLV